jgi:hypothetical protein
MATFLNRYKYVIFILFFIAVAAFSIYYLIKMKSNNLPLRGVFVRGYAEAWFKGGLKA